MKNTMFSQNEEALLEEIDRFVSYCLDNDKHQDVVLSKVQYQQFKTMCKRVAAKGIDRMNRVKDLDIENKRYRGFKISQEVEVGKRYTKRDLQKLF